MTPTASRLPLAFKLAYTAFVAVLVPHYWQAYGPTNFLYFCDIALLLTCVAMWRESAVLASACAVGILLPQCLWMVDFLGTWVGLPVCITLVVTGAVATASGPVSARILARWCELVAAAPGATSSPSRPSDIAPPA